MRRPAKGATTHPTQVRPGMGYGRPLRPHPIVAERVDVSVEITAFLRGESVGPRPGDRSSVTSSDSLA
jgi:hypothetical protein